MEQHRHSPDNPALSPPVLWEEATGVAQGATPVAKSSTPVAKSATPVAKSATLVAKDAAHKNSI